MTKKATLGPLVSLDPAMAALAARTAAAWRSEQDQMVDHDDGACFDVTAETVTDDQIRSLRTEASDHAVTVVCKRALSVHELRQACEQACRDIAEAVPTGQRIEVLNTALLERGLALGRALIAREQCAAAINARAKGGR